MPHNRCLQIPESVKSYLNILFLAKHALGDGTPDAIDGTHATYHHELLETLKAIGLQVTPASDFSAVVEAQNPHFLISMLNRAGFRGSEMLAPLMSQWRGLPCLGGSPITRGLTDDKHRMKQIVRCLGIPTPNWTYHPLGGKQPVMPDFDYDRLIVKPNASSASWGIQDFEDWRGARTHIERLHELGHDVIVEQYVAGYDVAASVIGSVNPWYLPIMRYNNGGTDYRTYEMKRNLSPGPEEQFTLLEADLAARTAGMARRIVDDIWPFDHGRLEFRIDEHSGEVFFIEVNINCNLWSKKTIAAAARSIDVTHIELVETIVCHSMLRQQVFTQELLRAA